MKNNTKLIMETWRRFLKEGPMDDIEGFYGKDYDPSQEEDENSINKPLPGEAPFEEEDPVPVDGMADGNNQPFDDEYNPEGIDKYGDPAKMGRGMPAPMLDNSGDDDMTDDSYDSYNLNDPTDSTGDNYYDEFGRPEEPGGDTLNTTGDYDDSYDM